MVDMTKMDKVWVATASLIYPEVDCNKCVSKSQITSKLKEMFNIEETRTISRYLSTHLISSIERDASKKNLAAGGSRNRYLFKTDDGIKPNTKGNFRLYKTKDDKYDGWEKTGKTKPDKEDVDREFHHFIEWYENSYFNSE